MYTVVYLYPVPDRHAAAFVDLQRAAGDRYRAHGAVETATYRPAALASTYGCAGFRDEVDVREDESLYVGLDGFRDEAHHDEVVARVDADPEVADLYEALTDLLDVNRVVRGEFERVA